MNNGLPPLLDAIFGKQDLDDISLDEIYELINEFPSFNAGHFLLSKKLKKQQESGYEKETMRTALYFNNPFWLESVLNEERLTNFKKTETPTKTEPVSDSSTEIEIPITETNDVLHHSSTDNRIEEENAHFQEAIQEQPVSPYSDGPVKSFDDLISKYHIESLTPSPDSLQSNVDESLLTVQQESREQKVESLHSEDETDSQIDGFTQTHEPYEEMPDDYEIREEVVNEYGIFEEVKIKKNDFDLRDFDRPLINLTEKSTDPANSVEETIAQPAQEISSVFPEDPDEPKEVKEINVSNEELLEQDTRSDYEAFDRPIDRQDIEDPQWEPELTSEEEGISEIYSGQDQIMESVESPPDLSDQSLNEITTLPGEDESGDRPSEEISEERKKAVFAGFDQKKAESIVFTPYHMIDYFASQGIKLNLEDNPADSFGRQLKSFTDWLKVMKKLPVHAAAEKTDEKEVDRIRHFAAHSVDEREILTESMAEVLAKQGMYENAIALFQKLSLIYPPKSAYFASRIEQIKASLP